MQRFLKGREYEALDDEEFTRRCEAVRAYMPAFLVVFAVLVALLFWRVFFQSL